MEKVRILWVNQQKIPPGWFSWRQQTWSYNPLIFIVVNTSAITGAFQLRDVRTGHQDRRSPFYPGSRQTFFVPPVRPNDPFPSGDFSRKIDLSWYFTTPEEYSRLSWAFAWGIFDTEKVVIGYICF